MTRGRLFVVSGPSGIGTGEIVSDVIRMRRDVGTVIPVTARKMKAGDENGKGLFFFDLDVWQEMRDCGDLLEETVFAGNDYGTSRRLVEEQLDAGKNVVLELEVERAAQIKANMPEAVCIYMEPSQELLQKQIETRARSRFETEVRLSEAKRSRKASDFCDFRLNSDDPGAAARELNRIMG